MTVPMHLPIIAAQKRSATATLSEILTELQSLGMRWVDTRGPGLSRAGGAGPSDHKAVEIDGQTVMIPILTSACAESPFEARADVFGNGAMLYRNGKRLAKLQVPTAPRFYDLFTDDGIPYWKIATLHSKDVLATTVLQHCIRYGNRKTSCQFCAIGQSLAARRTIAKKSPEQLAEVAEAAVRLDGVTHMVMTTGTPPTPDRGANVLSDCALAVLRRVEIPVQAQCEPPDDFAWFGRMRDAGVATLGMHLEAVTESVRRRIMPGKAEVSLGFYLEAFERAVEIFGRGQVTTYILAGLGDSKEAILEMSEKLVSLGVYPFVVPFVPIAGTPLEAHGPPDPAFLQTVLDGVAKQLGESDLRSQDIAAGCGRCGACSTLRSREVSPSC